eukprot:gene2657-2823_t
MESEFQTYLDSPFIQTCSLPCLFNREEIADFIKESWTSIKELAAIVEESFEVKTFLANHTTLWNERVFNEVEIQDINESYFKTSLQFTYQDDFYLKLAESTFENNRKLLNLHFEGMRVIGHLSFDTNFNNLTFVPDSFWQLYYLIELIKLINHRVTPRLIFIIEGTSGIGKTRFSLFYMVLATKRGSIFVYHYAPDRACLCGPGFMFQSYVKDIEDWLKENCKSCLIDYYFFDPITATDPESSIFYTYSKVSIAFVPPNTRMELLSRCIPTNLILKMPTLEDVTLMRELLYPQVSEAVFRRQLSFYGLVPRFLFDYPIFGIAGSEELENVVSLTRKEFLRKVVRGECNVWDGSDKEVSYLLIHLDSSDFYQNKYKFASDYVLQKLFPDQPEVLSQAVVH